MKRIHLEEEVSAQIRAVPQHAAMTIPHAIHRYAETGTSRVPPVSGEFEGMLRLRVGNYRVCFRESAEAIAVQRVADRLDAYR